MAHILLIDDDDNVRSLIRRILGRFGHSVTEARDGIEGLELYPRVNPDLLITDLMMPGKDGLELLTELREKYPPVKAIAISGGGRPGTDDWLHRAKSAGATKVLAKPFSREALMTAVNELLSTGRPASRGLAP